uniref:acyltransferase family protein n=1 Tax=Acetatifactor sp. TaxID=1872090 RepID=UPI004057C1D1
MNEKKHELLPDVLRGFAIFLMVFAHCIQAGSGAEFRNNSLYFQDKLYQFIYSFHMPLFMLIAGYFARKSIDRAQNKSARLALLKRRSITLLVPIFFWTFFEFVYSYIYNILHEQPNPSLTVLALDFIKKLPVNCWFLWAAFWCFLLVYMMHYYLRDSIILYILGFLSFFVLPDGMNLGVYKFMVPYYLAAFYSANYIRKEDNPFMQKLSSLRNLCICTALCGIVFAGLFLHYNEQSFIYTTGFHLIGKNVPLQIGIDIYRIIIGFVGSGFFILFWRILQQLFTSCRFRLLSLMGSNSLGIYLISGYVLLLGLVRITDTMEPSYLLNLVTAIFILMASTVLTLLLKRIPLLSRVVGKP